MARVSFLVLLAVLLAAGCARSADPLEWKLSARDPDDADVWIDKNFSLLPKDLAAELAVSINNIKALTPLGRGPEARMQKANRVCRQLDGHTVREVLIAGYELADDELNARITNESEALLRLLRFDDGLAPEEQAKLKKLVEVRQAHRESLKRALERNEQRLVELRTPPGYR